VISSALAGFCSGRQETAVIMLVSAVAAILNMGLDYLWIFGKFGFAEGGIVGAGVATDVSEWVKAIIYLTLILWRDRDGRFAVVRGMRFDAALLRRLIKFGGPNGLQLFIEMSAFSAYLLPVGQFRYERSQANIEPDIAR
jgi:MATE family multidrug resistance protein